MGDNVAVDLPAQERSKADYDTVRCILNAKNVDMTPTQVFRMGVHNNNKSHPTRLSLPMFMPP